MDIWPPASPCRLHIVKGRNHCSVGIITPAPHMRPYYSLELVLCLRQSQARDQHLPP